MFKFGVTVRYVDRVILSYLEELGVGYIQIPFHITRPALEGLDLVREKKIKVVAKFVPNRKLQSSGKIFSGRIEYMIEQYKDHVDFWDFGGEPETGPDQPGCRWFLTAQDFIDHFSEFSDRVKDQNPKIKVGCGGFLTPTFHGCFGTDSREDFFIQVLDCGLGDHTDFISLDHYVYGYGGEKSLVIGMVRVRDLLRQYKISVPIRIAEMGVPCAGDPDFFHIIQTQPIQAQSLVKMFVLFFVYGADAVTWFNLNDEEWGLLDLDGGRRASFRSLKFLVEFLNGFEFDQQLKVFPRKRCETDYFSWLRFRNKERVRDIVWMDSNHEIQWNLPNEIRALDMTQKKMESSPVFSSSPIYLVGPQLREYEPIQR